MNAQWRQPYLPSLAYQMSFQSRGKKTTLQHLESFSAAHSNPLCRPWCDTQWRRPYCSTLDPSDGLVCVTSRNWAILYRGTRFRCDPPIKKAKSRSRFTWSSVRNSLSEVTSQGVRSPKTETVETLRMLTEAYLWRFGSTSCGWWPRRQRWIRSRLTFRSKPVHTAVRRRGRHPQMSLPRETASEQGRAINTTN